jgi:hypothetical protein
MITLLIDFGADLLKPIDLDGLVDEIWALTRLPSIYQQSRMGNSSRYLELKV